MTHVGPLNEVPIACTLTPAAGTAQIGKWRAFDEDYGLWTEHTDTRLTVHYTNVEDSVRRLRELVAVESSCCTFVQWAIDDSESDLRLIVSGTSDQLAALDFGESVPGTRRGAGGRPR